MAEWEQIYDGLEVRPVDEDAGEYELTCQAHELTRLVGDSGRWRVLALTERADTTSFAIHGHETHLTTVAVPINRNRRQSWSLSGGQHLWSDGWRD